MSLAQLFGEEVTRQFHPSSAFNHSMRKSVFPRRQSVHNLVSKRRWKRVRAYLSVYRKPSLSDDVGDSSWLQAGGDGQKVIHLACRLDPPLEVVKDLVVAYPGALLTLDDRGQTPLHVAINNDASIEVIDFLVRRDREAASIQDDNGSTPLHLACERLQRTRSLRRNSVGSKTEQDIRMLTVVKTLCAASPKSVLLNNKNGQCALECAIVHGADSVIVGALQNLSQRMREKSKRDINRRAKSAKF